MRKREGADFGWLSLWRKGYFPALSRLRTEYALKMNHSFSVEHAVKYGIAEAILIGNFQFWLAKNRADKRNQYDGRTWTYNTASAFAELIPYFSTDKVDRIVKSLVKQGVILVSNYSDKSTDRTRWFAFANEVEFLGELPSKKKEQKQAEGQDQHPFRETAESHIPDSAKLRNANRESAAPFRETAESLYRTDITADVTTDKHGAAALSDPAAAEASSAGQTPPAVQAALEATPAAVAAEPPRVRSKSVDFLMAKGVEYQVAVDWMVARKTKQVTPTVWSLVAEEAEKAGITPVQAVTWAAGRGYVNFIADWYTPETPKTAAPAAPAGYTKYPAKPNILDANRAAAAAYMAERNARMGVSQAKDMGEIEQVPTQQNDFFGDNWEPA